ncbi:ketoacyl-synt-domain-containing protein [Byssothecium circinans]|uniref:Ketoacyl-synt-domain-containing protein n=1 Tax=Byssothecium circinans TaxID=147558 RepID=A0A6A5T7D7_9PLEO|nr:ketoacyl-synt-domain-containing protein [Byssothecium circinans]
MAPEPIAIVGMGCRLPGGVSSSKDLWELLRNKRNGYREFTSDKANLDGYYHPNPQRPGSFPSKGGYLLDEDPFLFDYEFFGLTKGEVLTMDPTQRKMLEVSYEALENAGEPWDKFWGSKTGVFVGNMNFDYQLSQISDVDFTMPHASTGGRNSILSNRVNHLLNLRGPSMSIDTACSSSLYALHLAVSALRNGDCDAAIVGGSNLLLSPDMQQITARIGALSPTSMCHSFDVAADGYARAEGFAALYLKRYSEAVDGDYTIRSVIRGTAINANGRTAGISHPSAEGQAALIRQAYRIAELPFKDTGYFECHGTGTPAGDTVEVSAIGKVFAADHQEEPLLIGSIKPNLGHAEPASGVIGVMKAILALENGTIPPTIGIENFNPDVDFEGARVHVITENTSWPKNFPKRASVNSFGYGGANAHVILDHPELLQPKADGIVYGVNGGHVNGTNGHDSTPEMNGNGIHAATRRLVLLPLSAHQPDALKTNVAALQEALPQLSLADTSFTLAKRRSKFKHKSFAIVEQDAPETGLGFDKLAPTTNVAKESPRVGFVFTGQGAQWQGMGKELFQYRAFRESIRKQDAVLSGLSSAPSWTLEDVLGGDSKVSVQDADVSQTVCTALQVALVDLLKSWSITPVVTVGHSSGEIAAAYASGSASLEDSIVAAFFRGKAIASNTRPGAMLAVGLSADDTRSLLEVGGFEEEVQIAAINSPQSVTVSGNVEAVKKVQAQLQVDGTFARLLHTGGNAYHSHHMRAIGEEYEKLLDNSQFKTQSQPESEAAVRWISSVHPSKKTTPTARYWRQNLESPVQFTGAIETILAQDIVDVLVEIGPHSALQGPLKQIIDAAIQEERKRPVSLSALRRGEDGMRNILTLAGQLWCLNYAVDVVAANATDDGRRGKLCVDLPPYRFNYGPPLTHDTRVARHIRERRHPRHDILGALVPGCHSERPVWRNLLRLHDVPWARDHRLAPNAVLPGSAYVCLAIEAASQFKNVAKEDNVCYRLRDVSIKSALQIPEDDNGVETMLHLQASSSSPKWLQFAISSASPDRDVWTVHATGLISVAPSSPLTSPRLEEKMDPRVVETSDWYSAFTEVGLEYGPSFQGLSHLQADSRSNICSAEIALNTTDGLFNGPESEYATIHPASLDMCNQLALISTHGGEVELMEHAFIPVGIDEMTVWSTKASQAKCFVVSNKRGLRGAHASVQLFTETGDPFLEIKTLRCVSYSREQKGRDALPAHEYMRLAWKPNVASLSTTLAAKLFPSASSEYANLESVLDLAAHQNPHVKILEVGAGAGKATRAALVSLGGATSTKRYSSYTITDSANDAIEAARNEFANFKNVEFEALDIATEPTPQGFENDYDLIIASELATDHLRNVRSLLKSSGILVLLKTDGTQELGQVFQSSGFSSQYVELNDGEGKATIVATAVDDQATQEPPAKDGTVYIVHGEDQDAIVNAVVSQLRTKAIDAVVSPLQSCELPHDRRHRVIFVADLKRLTLADTTEDDYLRIKSIVQRASSLLWVTEQDVLTGKNPEAHIATGLIRMLITEHPESNFGIVHVDEGSSKDTAAKIIADREHALHQGDTEHEHALQNEVAYIPRLVYDTDMNQRYRAMHTTSPDLIEASLGSQGPLVATFETPGILSSLFFHQDSTSREALPEDFIEIKTAAVTLGKDDWAACTGRTDAAHFSRQVSGVVTRCGSGISNFKPGDRVYAMADCNFSTLTRLPAAMAQLADPSDDLAHLSSLPIPFCTAVYALQHLGHLQPKEKVLVITDSEDDQNVGSAIVQGARYLGAEAVVAINSHIDEEKLKVATHSKGFNVIVNISTEPVADNISQFLARRGRFVNIGKVDAQHASPLSASVASRSATFASFDLEALLSEDPEFAAQLLQETGDLLRQIPISPSTSMKRFNISEIEHALAHLSQDTHGEQVIVTFEEASTVKVLPPQPQASFDPKAEYIIVGGLGGLGRAILQWMVEHGARNITVWSRSGAPNSRAASMIDGLSKRGIRITLMKCDITSSISVNNAIESMLATNPNTPIKGILHVAVTFSDTTYEKLTHAQWSLGLSAKVTGTQNLHAASLAYKLPLDFFFMTSSYEAVVALPTQAAYCAANSFMDAFARYRRSLGLPAVALAFGLITEIGVGQTDVTRNMISRNDLYGTGELGFLRLLEAAFLEQPASPAKQDWMHFDPLAAAQVTTCLDPYKLSKEAQKHQANAEAPRWRTDRKFALVNRAILDELSNSSSESTSGSAEPETPAIVLAAHEAVATSDLEEAGKLITQAIIERIAALRYLPEESFDPKKSVAEYGVDSLSAVELRSWLVSAFKAAIPLMTLLDEALSIADLGGLVLKSLVEEKA